MYSDCATPLLQPASLNSGYKFFKVNQPVTSRAIQADLEQLKIQFVIYSSIFMNEILLHVNLLKLPLSGFEVILNS